jgi:hypothetical protein
MPQPFFSTARGLLLSPREMFSQLRTESLGSAFRYLLLTLAIFVIFTAISRIMLLARIYTPQDSIGIIAILVAAGTIEAIMNFIYGTFGALMVGIWLHFWSFLLGARRGIGETIRAAFYAFTPVGLFGWIPLFAGTLFFGGFSLFGIEKSPGFIRYSTLAVIGTEILLVAWAFLIATYGIAGFQQIPENRAKVAGLMSFLIPLGLGIAGIIYLFSAYPFLWTLFFP